MARNSDRKFSALNRFVRAKESKEKVKKRPSLYQLTSAEEVKKWIPSITREIEYLLQQISGSHSSRNYPSSKIEEFKSRVDQLKKEHHQYVSKVRALDPSYEDITPWELRGYRRKRSLEARKSGVADLNANIAAQSEAPVKRAFSHELEARCNSKELSDTGILLGGEGEQEKVRKESKALDLDVSRTASGAASGKESCTKLLEKDLEPPQCGSSNLSRTSATTLPQTDAAGPTFHSCQPVARASGNPLLLDYSSSSSEDSNHEEGTSRKHSKLSEQNSIQ